MPTPTVQKLPEYFFDTTNGRRYFVIVGEEAFTKSHICDEWEISLNNAEDVRRMHAEARLATWSHAHEKPQFVSVHPTSAGRVYAIIGGKVFTKKIGGTWELDLMSEELFGKQIGTMVVPMHELATAIVNPDDFLYFMTKGDVQGRMDLWRVRRGRGTIDPCEIFVPGRALWDEPHHRVMWVALSKMSEFHQISTLDAQALVFGHCLRAKKEDQDAAEEARAWSLEGDAASVQYTVNVDSASLVVEITPPKGWVKFDITMGEGFKLRVGGVHASAMRCPSNGQVNLEVTSDYVPGDKARWACTDFAAAFEQWEALREEFLPFLFKPLI